MKLFENGDSSSHNRGGGAVISFLGENNVWIADMGMPMGFGVGFIGN